MILSIRQVTMIHGIMILTGINRGFHSGCPSVILIWVTVCPMAGRVIHAGAITIITAILPITWDTTHTGMVSIMDITAAIMAITCITPITGLFTTDHGGPLRPTGLCQHAMPPRSTVAV